MVPDENEAIDVLQEISELKAQMGMCLGMARSLAEHVGRGTGGREISLTITQLQEAGHWLHDASELLQPSGIDNGSSNQ